MPLKRKYGRYGPIVGAIDEGTSSARFMVFSAETSEVLTYHQVEMIQENSQEGWAEQDPLVILKSVEECIERTLENMIYLDIDPSDIVAVGIANQRETTILWDKISGKPLYNAILWLDVRTKNIVEELLGRLKNKIDALKPLCGLPLNPYFSALKIKWLMDNVEDVQCAIREDRCLFGTVDSWLIWNLTGGTNGGIHVTDVTNASRTMLMNIKTLKWDRWLCDFFNVPLNLLPKIYSSSEIFGYITSGRLRGIPISGCLGDQQAALVGQMCFKPGEIKNTCGTGGFVLCNTGKSMVQSNHGLLTTVAYQLGKKAAPAYALEGSIAIAGAALKWLKENLGMFEQFGDIDSLLKKCSGFGEVYFVPSFNGLHAPYWKHNAKSLICGIQEDTKKEHLITAALESVCFQTRDILEAMRKDYNFCFKKLFVDGGMAVSNCFIQLQADLCGILIVRAAITESTALGAAMAAGMADGIKVWDIVKTPKAVADKFMPRITKDERDLRYQNWKMAIDRSLWTNNEDFISEEKIEETRKLKIRSSSGPAIFALISLGLLILSHRFYHV